LGFLGGGFDTRDFFEAGLVVEGRGVVGMTVTALTSELLIWGTVDGDLVIDT